MSTSADLELTRAAALLDTDAAAAARRARAILESEPRHEAAALLLAAACRRLGEPVGAIDAIEGLAATWPDTAMLQLELGCIYAASGRRAAPASRKVRVKVSSGSGTAINVQRTQRTRTFPPSAVSSS